jgi:hypothetical protein
MIQDLINDITLALISHAEKLGRFQKVNGAEPKGAPPNGLSVGIWVDDFRPHQRGHGLATTSMLLTMNARVYTDMLAEPDGRIDPEMMDAVGAFLEGVSADFQLDSMEHVQAVDLTGMTGQGLGGRAGYVEVDRTLFRIFTISVPIILNDVFSQVA